jgi:hypothetical protein
MKEGGEEGSQRGGRGSVAAGEEKVGRQRGWREGHSTTTLGSAVEAGGDSRVGCRQEQGGRGRWQRSGREAGRRRRR